MPQSFTPITNTTKLLSTLCLGLIISGCKQTINMGVSEAVTNEQVAQLKLTSNLQITKLDGQTFRQLNGKWANNGDIIRLAPGKHTFTFNHRANNYIGVILSRAPTTLGDTFVAGGIYEVKATFEGLNGHIELVQTAGPQVDHLADLPDDIIKLMQLLQLDNHAYGSVMGIYGKMEKHKSPSQPAIDCAIKNTSLRIVQKHVAKAVLEGFDPQAAKQFLAFFSTPTGQIALDVSVGRLPFEQAQQKLSKQQIAELLTFQRETDLDGRLNKVISGLKSSTQSLIDEISLKCGWNLKN